MKPICFIRFLAIRVRGMAVVLLLGASIQSAISESNAQSGINDAPSKPASVKRDPFWPVGYVPEKLQNAASVERTSEQVKTSTNDNWNEAMQQVVINGVSSRGDSESFAVINNQVMKINDSVSIKYRNATYTWAVESITPPSSVKLRRISVQ